MIRFLLTVLVALLPFELRGLPVASSLQWLFVVLVAASLPTLIRERKTLLSDRLVLAAGAFVLTQWIAAALATEFQNNAALGALRVTMGFVLLCIALSANDEQRILRVWSGAAITAAIYAVLEYNGLGLPGLFHIGEFWFGPIQRLSGSFEYPNTAAAYFSMSLPIVWTAVERRWIRLLGCAVLLVVLILTYSRGAVIALLAMLCLWAILQRSKSIAMFAS